MDELQKRVESLSERVSALETRVNNHQAVIGKLLNIVKELSEVGSAMGKATLAGFKSLGGRVGW